MAAREGMEAGLWMGGCEREEAVVIVDVGVVVFGEFKELRVEGGAEESFAGWFKSYRSTSSA